MFINKNVDGKNNICGTQVALLRKKMDLSQRELADKLWMLTKMLFNELSRDNDL